MRQAEESVQSAPNQLLWYLEGSPTQRDIAVIREVLALLGRRSGWLVGAPQLVNEGQPDDWTLGLLLELPRCFEPLDVEVERRSLADVEAVVKALGQVPSALHLSVAVELDGDVVGWVEGGRPDQLLSEGLLEPWRARLASLNRANGGDQHS